MSLLRAFIALEISSDVRLAIHKSTAQLRSETGSWIHWVPTENMHLTLKFLGDVSPAQVKQLTEALEGEAKLHAPFEINIGRLNAFPNTRRPRVIFLGISAPAVLRALAAGVEALCVRLGHDAESRKFHPHLTLGRVRQGVPGTEQEKMHNALATRTVDVPGTATVDSVHLYQSNLNSRGAVHTKLFTAPFQAVIASHVVAPNDS